MPDNRERKAARRKLVVKSELSFRTYNLVLGAVVLWGLLINALLVSFCSDFFMSIDYGLYIVIYFVLCIAGSLIAYSSKNPLVSFLGYNLIVIPVGGLLSICIPTLSEGVVTAAMLETAIIVGLMIIFSCIYPGFF